MHLLFLIPLTTAMVASYIFRNPTDEMADLTGLVIVVSLILSLVLAPWQLQFGILTLVIVSTRQFLLQIDSRMQLEDNQEERATE